MNEQKNLEKEKLDEMIKECLCYVALINTKGDIHLTFDGDFYSNSKYGVLRQQQNQGD